MPGEFEPHAGTYMLWPERPDNWRLGAEPAQRAFAEVAAAISDYEPVTMGASAGQYERARKMLPEAVRVVELSCNDAWMRDCGPTFVKNGGGEVRGVCWGFNAWGGLADGLYAPWDEDARVARKLCEMERKDCYFPERFVLEGGSIHVDGEGTAVATEACLLSSGRNPGMSKEQIECTLKEYLGVEKVIWLKRGIYLDETNEHADNACAFVKPGEAVLAWTDDERDPQYGLSASCLEILENETDAKGRRIRVHKLRLPAPAYMTEEESRGIKPKKGTKPRRPGDRLAASYVNYYVCNGAVVMPGFGDPQDEAARETLRALCPGREVIQVFSREILLGGGNIHCITQQMPK
jgi:agmatine deiminase